MSINFNYGAPQQRLFKPTPPASTNDSIKPKKPPTGFGDAAGETAVTVTSSSNIDI